MAGRGRVDDDEVESVPPALEPDALVLPLRDADEREEVLEPRRGGGDDAKGVAFEQTAGEGADSAKLIRLGLKELAR